MFEIHLPSFELIYLFLKWIKVAPIANQHQSTSIHLPKECAPWELRCQKRKSARHFFSLSLCASSTQCILMVSHFWCDMIVAYKSFDMSMAIELVTCNMVRLFGLIVLVQQDQRFRQQHNRHLRREAWISDTRTTEWLWFTTKKYLKEKVGTLTKHPSLQWKNWKC